MEKKTLAIVNEEKSEALLYIEKDIDFIIDILNENSLEADFSFAAILLKTTNNYEKRINELEERDTLASRRIQKSSIRLITAVNNYSKGILFTSELRTQLKAETKILKRIISFTIEKNKNKKVSDFSIFIKKELSRFYALISTLAIIIMILFFSYFKSLKKLKSVADSLGTVADENIINQKIDEIKKNSELISAEKEREIEREKFIHRRYKEILNSVSAGILAVGSDDLIIFTNSILREWFNTEKDFAGEKLATFLKETEISDLNKGRVSRGEKAFWVLPKTTADTRFYIFQDITEQEQLSTKLLHSERLISMGEIATKVTHEIRNPLSTIKMNSEYLLENAVSMESCEVASSLSLIVKEVIRLEEITERYMGLVRYRAGDELAPFAEFPDDITEFAAFHLWEIEKKGISLKLKFFPAAKISMPLYIFKEVLLNLVKNAWEELQNGGTIELSAELCDDHINLFVDDSGSGVAPQDREKIFTIFYTNKPGGTGIGLSHSRKRVEEAGGKLFVEDSPLGGARFVVMLPLLKT